MRKPFNGDYPLTQGFGLNPADYAKFNLKGHNGLDYGLPSNTPVVAPHNGIIKEMTFDPLGYGWYIKIENDTEGSVLAHLSPSNINVRIGDFVDEGQQLALSDNSGNSTGPHLHWGYYRFPRDRQNGFNGYIDQLPLLNGITPDPIPVTTTPIGITDQTRIPQIDNKEVQQIKSELLDKDTRIKQLEDQLNYHQIPPVAAPNPVPTPPLVTTNPLIDFVTWLFNKFHKN